MKRWEGRITINTLPEKVWKTLLTSAVEGSRKRFVEPIAGNLITEGSKLLEYIYY